MQRQRKVCKKSYMRHMPFVNPQDTSNGFYPQQKAWGDVFLATDLNKTAERQVQQTEKQS